MLQSRHLPGNCLDGPKNTRFSNSHSKAVQYNFYSPVAQSQEVQHHRHTIHSFRYLLLADPFWVHPEYMSALDAFTMPGGYFRVLCIHDLLAHFLPWDKSHPRASFPRACFWKFILVRLNFW